MKKRQILLNALTSTLQVAVISAVLFILYRFLLRTIGVSQLGIWSLVLATTSVTQIANLGLSGSVVKFVAKYLARNDKEGASHVIQTATLSVACISGIVILLGYPLAKWVLNLVVPSDSVQLALSILPFALFALWTLMVTSVFQAGLDGVQRIDYRNWILMGGAIIHLLLCIAWAPGHGLLGVAYARVVQNVSVMAVSWLILKRNLPMIPLIPTRWKRTIFREIIGYGINFQVITVTSMFFDPITKGLLSKFGGLTMVGYYEMASRMVQQVRSLVVSANQVIVPAVSDMEEKSPERVIPIYKTSYELLIYLSLPLFALMVALTPLVSELWIGAYENHFVIFSMVLAFAWFMNMINAPAYFTYLGTGLLRWNVVAHIVIALLNLALGLASGILFGGMGVVVAWAVSLAMGSSIVLFAFHRENDIPFREVIPRSTRPILIMSSLAIFSSLLFYRTLSGTIGPGTISCIIVAACSIMVGIPLWMNPMRLMIADWLGKELLGRDT